MNLRHQYIASFNNGLEYTNHEQQYNEFVDYFFLLVEIL